MAHARSPFAVGTFFFFRRVPLYLRRVHSSERLGYLHSPSRDAPGDIFAVSCGGLTGVLRSSSADPLHHDDVVLSCANLALIATVFQPTVFRKHGISTFRDVLRIKPWEFEFLP